MTLTYGEVFAGGGGLSLGFERAGLKCAFHAEIEEFPRRVLRAHWPDTPLLGDVRAITGGRRMKRWMQERFSGVDLISGGSPCQDLSVAGNRAGQWLASGHHSISARYGSHMPYGVKWAFQGVNS